MQPHKTQTELADNKMSNSVCFTMQSACVLSHHCSHMEEIASAWQSYNILLYFPGCISNSQGVSAPK